MARKAREATAATFAPSSASRPAAKVFADIAARSKSFRPARETLKRVRAVPTIFPQVDRALRVGGWPIDRVGLIHGPSGDGKTVFALGLGLSFLRRGHLFCHVDAELTTPMSWLESLYGEHADNPAFLASRPTTYEQAVDDVRKIAVGVADARVQGKLSADTTCLFLIDSVRKLVPSDLMERIKKWGADGEKGSIDGYGGRAAQLRAALNAAWMDELVPLMYTTGCGIVFISRETDDPNASAKDRQFGEGYKVGGGKSLVYDSSIVARIEHAKFVTIGPAESKTVVGERVRVDVYKSKVAAQQDRSEEGYFHLSNGVEQPEGYDRARDLLEVGVELGVVKQSGSWYSFGGHRYQGEAKFVEKAGPVLDAIEAKCREKFTATKIADVVGG